MIYLDNAATTKISPLVLEEMMPYLKDEYGNPGTIYSLGRRAWVKQDKKSLISLVLLQNKSSSRQEVAKQTLLPFVARESILNRLVRAQYLRALLSMILL